MDVDRGLGEDRGSFEIGLRFRRIMEQRIARLESDAAQDEAAVSLLLDGDHIRRQMRLVAAQRAEAMRMCRFLDQSRTRQPNPMTAL